MLSISPRRFVPLRGFLAGLLVVGALSDFGFLPSLTVANEESKPPVVEIPSLSITLEGRWVLDERGEPVAGRPGRRERGLQTSGLLEQGGILWSVGDQRSEYAGKLLPLDPSSSRLAGPPVSLEIPGSSVEGSALRQLADWPNPDFEGLAAIPGPSGRFLAITEDRHSWIITLSLGSDPESPSRRRARVEAIATCRFPEDLRPFREDTNTRLEGITVWPADPPRIVLAYERHEDGLPRLLTAPLGDVTRGGELAVKDLEIDFSRVARRPGKERARLNLNGLAHARVGGSDWILGVARDQERLLVIDPAARQVSRIVNLDLVSPGGGKMLWVSPEGLAVDAGRGQLWLINDPDSVRGNYRALETEMAEGHFAALAPQLFRIPLESILPGARD